MKNKALLHLLLFCIFISVFSTANGLTSLRIDHDYRSILRDIPIDNACLTASEVRSLRTIRTCVKLEHSNEALGGPKESVSTWTCRKYANVTLAYPRQVETRECAQMDRPVAAEYSPVGICRVWSYGTLTLPRTIEIRVTKNVSYDTPQELTETKTFSFPDCP
jgi:hypothetical protein